MNRFSIVLANLMNERGGLNAETAARVDLAAQIENNQESNLILLCGWPYRPDSDIAIADAMKAHLLTMHPALLEKSRCQKLSRDTVGDAVFSRIFLDTLTGRQESYLVNVVTSDYHVNRSREIFEFVFPQSCSVTVSGVAGFQRVDSAAKEAKSIFAFRNTFKNAQPGDLGSIFCALRNDHPFYNGTIYPRIKSLNDVTRSLTGISASQ